MMPIPQLQIQSVNAKIGMKSEAGKFDISQPRAQMNIQTEPSILNVKSEQPVVVVDMSAMWDALNGGSHLQYMNRIYNQSGKFVVEAVRGTVEEYNRIGEILTDVDQVGEVAWSNLTKEPVQIEVYGSASYDNVQFEAEISKPDINFNRGHVEIDIRPQKVEVSFTRGQLQIYMERYPSLQISVPKVDMFG
ncbi:DUF6470 family protein [Paenibacillus agaridevorans]|uniref:DUF6470 family protein n=1 Tax=Paenibacillus agaridevorans TaxID=171404 RepID=UPI001BE41E7C|nr:DUF6470 family protein [Paenibacillus agaridevorans]